MRSELRFGKLRVLVRLGWSEDEKRVPQPIDVSFRVRFARPPAACETDQLAETVCYGELSEVIRAACAERPFNLIEKLGHDLYGAVKRRLPGDARLTLEVTKVSPPIPNLTEGVTFLYGDAE